MTLREVINESFCDCSLVPGTYDIGFINTDRGYEREDETEFDIQNTRELLALWIIFCQENGFDTNSVEYVRYVGRTEY